MLTRKENAWVEEVKCRWGGESWVTLLPSKAAVGRLRWALYDVECHLLSSTFQVAGVSGWCSSVWFWLLSLSGQWKNLFFYSSPILKLDQLWSFFIFYWEGHRLVEKLLLILFFIINSINISPCADPVCRDAFFSFWKKSQLWQHMVSALLSFKMELPLFYLYDKSEEISISHITRICSEQRTTLSIQMYWLLWK